ncbi:MAG TPA: hypothetical protein ENJ65_01760, partial [Candidatus Tenderia electrophaga]|nr:hypothetical protein [Candidatus Tenderia electrophaga]
MPTVAYNETAGRPEYRATVLAGVTSDPLYLPPMKPGQQATVGVSPGAGGTAKVEYTLSPRALVDAGDASVIWRAWPFGDVSSDTDDMLDGPVTALRITATTT